MHLRLLAKLARPICAMFAPGSPSSISARTGLPLLSPGRFAHVEMGVEGDQRDPVQWQSKPEHAGPRDRIVAADKQRELVKGRAKRQRLR